MGFWRTHYFKSERSFASNAQTEVFDLPSSGIISQLMIELRATSGSTNGNILISDVLTKVEVIGNGSTVIKSYNGRQIQAIMAYDDGRFPMDKEYSPSGTSWGYFDVRFGRFMGDEKYALDCGKWDSLELKLTYAIAAGGTAGTTGFTDDSGKWTIYGRYAPVGADFAPVGYIKSEEKKTYTSAASTDYDLDLPSDYPYRRLMLFQETLGTDVQHGFQYITIDVNEGSKKPLDRFTGSDMRVWQAMLNGGDFYWVKRFYLAAVETWTTFYGALRYIRQVQPVGGAAATAAYVNVLDPHQFSVRGTGSGAGWIQVGVTGLCPHGCLNIDLEKQSGGRDGQEAMVAAWGATEKDDIDLHFTAGRASLALSILLEQYVTR